MFSSNVYYQRGMPSKGGFNYTNSCAKMPRVQLIIY